MPVSENLIPSYFLVSASVILIYDYLLTVRLEVEHVWLSSFNWITIVYLIQRYLPFVDTVGLFLYGTFSQTFSTEKCNVINHLGHSLHIVGITLSEIVLTARAYAACRGRFGNRRLLATLATVVSLFWVPILVTTEITPSTQLGNVGHVVSRLDLPGKVWPSTICTMHSHSPQPLLFLTYVCAAAHGTIILAMMITAGYPVYRAQGYSQVFRLVYSDGIIYYVLLILINLANEILIFTTLANYAFLLMPLTRVVHATLTSRTVLHIREMMDRKTVRSGTLNDMDVDEWEMSTIGFRSSESGLEGRGPA